MRTVPEPGECSLISEYVTYEVGVGMFHDTCIRGKLESVRNLKYLFGQLDVVLVSQSEGDRIWNSSYELRGITPDCGCHLTAVLSEMQESVHSFLHDLLNPYSKPAR